MATRGFARVRLPEGVSVGGRASQTLLGHYNACPRSGFLYLAHRGEASTPEMQRGKALHSVIERAIVAAKTEGERSIPGELVKVIVNEVLGEQAVPFEEHDYIREMAYRWAGEFMMGDGPYVHAVETLFQLDVDGFMVRAKIDFAEEVDGDDCYVADWKSSRYAPSFDEIARVRPHDRSLAAKNFQLILYALELAYGVPVRIEQCPTCGGEGERFAGPYTRDPTMQGDVVDCPECEGRGYFEHPDPIPVATRAERFHLEFVYPGIEDRDGRMLRRPVTITRLELSEYLESLRGLVKRLRESEETGDWPAVSSDAACGVCPCAVECPIPREMRAYRGTINSLEQASEAAEVVDRARPVNDAIMREVKAWSKAHGVGVPLGSDRILDFVYSERETFDLKGWRLSGGPPERFVKKSKSTNFKATKLEES